MAPEKDLDRQPSHARWPLLATGKGHPGEGTGASLVASYGAVTWSHLVQQLWVSSFRPAQDHLRSDPEAVRISLRQRQEAWRHVLTRGPAGHRSMQEPGVHVCACNGNSSLRQEALQSEFGKSFEINLHMQPGISGGAPLGRGARGCLSG